MNKTYFAIALLCAMGCSSVVRAGKKQRKGSTGASMPLAAFMAAGKGFSPLPSFPSGSSVPSPSASPIPPSPGSIASAGSDRVPSPYVGASRVIPPSQFQYVMPAGYLERGGEAEADPAEIAAGEFYEKQSHKGGKKGGWSLDEVDSDRRGAQHNAKVSSREKYFKYTRD